MKGPGQWSQKSCENRGLQGYQTKGCHEGPSGQVWKAEHRAKRERKGWKESWGFKWQREAATKAAEATTAATLGERKKEQKEVI